MKQYINLLKEVLVDGEVRTDRTGTGTKSIFGAQMKFDLRDGFPLVTTKKMFVRGLIEEMLWFISGKTNIKPLVDKNVHIWDAWADEQGNLGPVYGAQWRNWIGLDAGGHMKITDQLQNAIDDIINKPDSRRIIVNAWNVSQVDDMALPPCHMFYQFYVHTNNVLDLHLYIRSNDLALGCPFNIAQYACLLMMVAGVTNKQPGTLVYTIGDAHIYLNHIKGIEEQVERQPFDLPNMVLRQRNDITDYVYEDFSLQNYQCHPAIKFDVAV